MSEFVVPSGSSYDKIIQYAKKQKMFDASAIRTLLSLFQFINNFSSMVEKHFGRYGLSQGRFGIIMVLFAQPKDTWTPADLAESLSVTRATITGLLDGLEKSKLIERQAHPQDRRKLIVTLTQDGIDCAKKMTPVNFQFASQLLKELSNQEKQELVKLLGKMNQGVERVKEDLIKKDQSD